MISTKKAALDLSLTEIVSLLVTLGAIAIIIIAFWPAISKLLQGESLCQNEAEWQSVTYAMEKIKKGASFVEIPFYNEECKLVSFAPQQTFAIKPAAASLLTESSKLCLCEIEERSGNKVCIPQKNKCIILPKDTILEQNQFSTAEDLPYTFIAFVKENQLLKINAFKPTGRIASSIKELPPPKEPLASKIKPSPFNANFYQKRALGQINLVVLHHTGGSSYQGAISTLEQRKLASHFVLDKDGTLYRLLGEDIVGGHATGYNTNSIGIEIVNTGRKEDSYTDAQYESIRLLLEYYQIYLPNFKIDDEHVLGHYETSKILCDEKRNTRLEQCGKWDPSPNFDWSKIGLLNHRQINLAEVNLREFGYA